MGASLSLHEVLSVGEFILYVLSIIYPLVFFTFDFILFLAIFKNRRDASYPVAYITVFSTLGMLTTFAMALNTFVFLVLPQDSYEAFLTAFGRETTLAGTFSYLNVLFITIVMTVNRIYMAFDPLGHQLVFTQSRVFSLCGASSLICLGSLLIPYFSDCHVIFRIDTRSFLSGCAPDRHWITTIQNTYAIIVPFLCMFANIWIVFHLSAIRNGTYIRIANHFRQNKIADVQQMKEQRNKAQIKREFTMIRSTIAITAFLSIYELGAFLIRTFPNQYAMLPEWARVCLFYFRYESIPVLNFFIYYVKTPSTRNMIRRFLKIKDKKSNSDVSPTVVTVAAKTTTTRGATAAPKTLTNAF